MLSESAHGPLHFLSKFFNPCAHASARSETCFSKPHKNFNCFLILFCFDLTKIVILFVVVALKFHVLVFAHIAFSIVDADRQHFGACAAFFFFNTQKNALSFSSFEPTKFCRQCHRFDVVPIFVC